MQSRVNPCNALEIAHQTAYGQKLYNHQPPARDRLYFTLSPYTKPAGENRRGFKPYNIGPLPMINTGFGGRFAIADLPQIPQPPPWERIRK